MSNFLAVATVTAGFVQLLEGPVAADVPGAQVTWVRPNGQGAGTPSAGVNLFLYQVLPNIALRNEDLPTRDAQGQFVQRPRAALNLHYLFSFYGDEGQFEPQRVLGSVVRILHEQPVFTRDLINDTLNSNPVLAASNLADEIERVKITPSDLPLEELSKLWSVFFQVPYALSAAYQASVVFVESEAAPRQVLPVRRYTVYTLPFQQPAIEKLYSEEGEGTPLTSGGTLVVQGKNLRGDETWLKLAGVLVQPDPGQVTPNRINLPLTAPPFPAGQLRAGVQGVQVVHNLLMGLPAVPHTGFESNVAPLLIHPKVSAIAVANPQDNPDGTRSADIQVTVDPIIGKNQRVVLLLNEKGAPVPRSYVFVGGRRTVDTASVTIPVTEVIPGTYLLRTQVDGAESLLEVDGDPQHPVFSGPEVTI